jgi:hypothetical protein
MDDPCDNCLIHLAAYWSPYFSEMDCNEPHSFTVANELSEL